ncbi:cytidylyltransferase domain-containing protein [Paenibacillus sp. OV219]|uniref:cytidylyltransferase domain-containing protein n=1 Tax=Paenibacillus sp. OV219 TaxID=1884377 RepID=UPI0008CF60C6|nr:glycosyltransferase family protein [Paenibacillus sp. OV219]SEN65533.1 spore coat polysaccharide biosynthesis protein SpsF [Paenibacillus sp. OV219]
MKIAIIIQARMGSSRLPGKVLMPLGNSCVLDYVVSRCRQVEGNVEVIVATSRLEQDDAIERWCDDHQVACYRGSEDDVLSRYVEAAASSMPTYVMRVTSDCPFVDYHLANGVIAEMAAQPSDLVVVKGSLPRGLVVELISYEALLRIHEVGLESRHREHVTYYAYEYPGEFTRTEYEASRAIRYPELRITLDTEEDYELCKAVASAFQGDKLVPSSEVVAYLNQHHEIAKLNAHIEQKPVV